MEKIQKFNEFNELIKNTYKNFNSLNLDINREIIRSEGKLLVISLLTIMMIYCGVVMFTGSIISLFTDNKFLLFILPVTIALPTLFIFKIKKIENFVINKVVDFLEKRESIIKSEKTPKYNIFNSFLLKKLEKLKIEKIKKLKDFNFLADKQYLDYIDLLVKDNQPSLDSESLSKYAENYKNFKNNIKNEDKSYALVDLGFILNIIEKNKNAVIEEKEMTLNDNI